MSAQSAANPVITRQNNSEKHMERTTQCDPCDNPVNNWLRKCDTAGGRNLPAPHYPPIRLIAGLLVVWLGFSGAPAQAQSSWTLLTNGTPSARAYAPLAEDPARGRLVMFGGTLDGLAGLDETWEWNSAAHLWQQVASGVAHPSARFVHASAYWSGATGHHVLIFGGQDNLGTSLGDTWTWDGSTWQAAANSGPSARVLPAMASETARSRALLFGGYGAGGLQGDTWVWNGSSWKSLPVAGPSARAGHAMAYDAARDRVVLFGGQDSTGYTGDTWEWDGTNWVIASTSGPMPRRDHTLAYVGGHVVLFGGVNSANVEMSDTWEWDGTFWRKTPIGPPPPRASHSMASDSTSGTLLMYGGADVNGAFDDTWSYVPGNYTVFYQLAQQALGSASLTSTPDGKLTVSNIGSSGQDGIAVALPDVAGFRMLFDDPNPNNVPVTGAFLRFRARGALGTQTDQALGELRVQASSGDPVIMADFPLPGVASRTVQAYSNGVLVAQVSNQTGNVGVLRRKPWWKPSSFEAGWDDGPVFTVDWHLGSARVALNGGPEIDCDLLVVTPENFRQAGSFSQVNVQAANWPDLVINNESIGVRKGGLVSYSLNFAKIEYSYNSSRRLPVRNLGSSGQDGVEIKWPPAKRSTRAMDLAWDDLDPGGTTLSNNAYLDMTTLGFSNGIPAQVLMTTRIQKVAPSNYSIAVTHPGVDTHTVEVWSGSNLVATVHGQNGSSPVGFCGNGMALDYHPELGMCTLTWFGPGLPPWEALLGGRILPQVQFQLTGLPNPVTGDRLVIRRDDSFNLNAAAPSEWFVRLQASNIPQIVLTQESARDRFHGLEFNNIGDANVAANAAGVGLSLPPTSDGLAPTGPQGVRATFGGATAFDASFEVIDSRPALPDGTLLQAAYVGAAGTNVGDMAVLQAQAVGSNWVYTTQLPGFSNSTYTIEARLQGKTVARLANQSGGSLGSAARLGAGGYPRPMFDTHYLTDEPPIFIITWNPTPIMITLPGSGGVTMDELRVIPNASTAGVAIRALELRAQGITNLVVTDAAIKVFTNRVPATVLRGASLRPDPGLLTISDLGTNGLDGVRFDVGIAGDTTLALDPIPGPLPAGATLRADVVGSFNGVPNQPLGNVQYTVIDPASPWPLAITADFTAINSPSQLLIVRNNGADVGVFPGHTGPVGNVSSLPRGVGKTFGQTKCIRGRYAANTSFQINGVTLIGDELLILAETTGGHVDYHSSVSLRAAGLTAIGIRGVSITPAPVTFLGQVHTPLGSAALATTTNKPVRLIVNNLGSSGQDGVAISLGHAASAGVSLDPLGLPPIGAFLQFSADGSINGQTNQPLGWLRVTRVSTAPGGYQVTADLSPDGSPTQRVEVWGGGVLLAAFPGHSGVVGTVSSMPIGGGKLRLNIGPPIKGCLWDDFPVGTDMFVNGVHFVGDQLRVLQESGPGADFLSALNVTAGGISSFTINNETIEHAPVRFYGFLNTPTGTGDAFIDATGALTVGNIGSSGQDGVSINLGQALSCEVVVKTNKLRLRESPTLSHLRFSATGSSGGKPNASLGYVDIACVATNPSSYQVTADLTPEGSPTQRIEVWSQGKLQAAFPGHTGPVATVGSWPTSFGKLGVSPTRLPCYRGGWPWPTDIFVNGIHFVGDQILILQETGPTLDFLSSFNVTGANIDGFEIVSESATQAPVVFSGYTNTALGTAMLDTTTGQLVVGNLGSSGQDGVSIALWHGASAGVSFTTPAQDPLGAFVQFNAIGSINGLPNQSLGWLRVTHVAATAHGYQVTADLSPDGSPTQRIEIWGQGEMLAAFPGHTGTVASVTSLPIGGGKLRLNIGPPIKGCLWSDFAIGTDIFVDGIHFVGDQIRVLQESGPGADYLSALNLTAGGVPSFTISSETVVHAPVNFSGFLNTPTGQADVYVDATGALSVGNIGSSGQDGVNIDFGPSLSCDVVVKTNKLRLRESPTLSHLRFSAWGSVSGNTNRPLGYVDIRCLQTNDPLYEVTADLNPDGSPTQRIEVWNQGTLLGAFPGHSGVVATVSAWPTSFGKLGPNALRLPCFRGNWPWPTRININGIQFLADQLLILQESGPVLDYLSRFAVTAGDVDGFEIASESAVPLRTTLTTSLSGSTLTIQWTGGGVLQESNDLTTWTDLLSATSPYQTGTGAPRKYYRVRQ